MYTQKHTEIEVQIKKSSDTGLEYCVVYSPIPMDSRPYRPPTRQAFLLVATVLEIG